MPGPDPVSHQASTAACVQFHLPARRLSSGLARRNFALTYRDKVAKLGTALAVYRAVGRREVERVFQECMVKSAPLKVNSGLGQLVCPRLACQDFRPSPRTRNGIPERYATAG